MMVVMVVVLLLLMLLLLALELYKTQKNCDIGRLEPNYVPIESYIAVRYRDVFAIRVTHA